MMISSATQAVIDVNSAGKLCSEKGGGSMSSDTALDLTLQFLSFLICELAMIKTFTSRDVLKTGLRFV